MTRCVDESIVLNVMQDGLVLKLPGAAQREELASRPKPVGMLTVLRHSAFLHQILPSLPRAIYIPDQGFDAASAPMVLELGCGDGIDARKLACRGYHVTAVDLRTAGFWSGGQQLTFMSTDIRFIMEHWKAESLDVVYSHLGVHYFDDAETAALFRNSVRALKPGGYLCFLLNSTFDPDFPNLEHVVPGDVNDEAVFWETGYRIVNGTRTRFFDLVDVARYVNDLPVEIITLDTDGMAKFPDGKKKDKLVRVVLRKKH